MASGHAMFRIKTGEDEVFNELRKCLEPLRENKVQIDRFPESFLLSFGMSPVQMVKHVRVLTTIPYKDVRDSVLAKAHSLGICPLSDEINLLHIYQICNWMKTKAGIAAVVEVNRSEKLKRRAAAKGMTSAESAMVIAFNAQFHEYSTELKKPGTALRQDVKYWPVSAFGVATNRLLEEDVILDFCRKEGVKYGLYKYVEGLIERKEKSFALREADKLKVVLKEMEYFEVPDSSKDGNCRKRKDVESVFDDEADTSSMTKRKTPSKK